jgi:predicted RNase H-like HicB family nuclease
MGVAAERMVLEGIILEQDGWHVAVCVNYFFTACARTRDELIPELKRCIFAHLEIAVEHGLEPFQNLRPAPERYQRMLEKAKRLASQRVEIEPPPAELLPRYPAIDLREAVA